MFPLGVVLFPGAVLPLHVFEPRYRELVRYCTEHEPEFGVVLIERGSEVGGGEVRNSVGTIARIMQLSELDDGRFALITVGTRRFEVAAWLPDDPYPVADVDEINEAEPAPEFEVRLAKVVSKLRRVLAVATEAGVDAMPATTEISDDPLVGQFHAAALAPLGPSDQFALLACHGPDERLELLDHLLDEQEATLRLHMSAGSETLD